MATVPAATDQLTVTADSRLSDDYLLVSQAQVTGNLSGAVCLAGSQDGTRLCHFAILGGVASELQPSDQSPTGTAAVQLPGGEGASQIAGFVNYDGSVHACYVTEQGLMHAQRDAGGQWTTAEVALADPAVTALGTAGIVWTGAMVVTGISSEGDLVLLAEDGSAWSASVVPMGGALMGFTVIRLCYTTSTTWALFAADGNGPLQIWEGNADGLQGPKSVTVAADVAGIWFCYSHDESPMAIFSDVNGALYYSTGYANQVTTSVELSGVTSGAGLIGPDNYIHFFATDGDGTLWVMRQTKWHGAKPHWAPLFQLDTGVSFVTATSGAFSAASAATMALSAVHDQGSIDLLSQPGTAGLWNRAPVQVPGPDQTVAVNRYRTRLTVTDANGLPSPGTQIQVMPSELVALEVAGNSVSCSPDAAAFLDHRRDRMRGVQSGGDRARGRDLHGERNRDRQPARRDAARLPAPAAGRVGKRLHRQRDHPGDERADADLAPGFHQAGQRRPGGGGRLGLHGHLQRHERRRARERDRLQARSGYQPAAANLPGDHQLR